MTTLKHKYISITIFILSLAVASILTYVIVCSKIDIGIDLNVVPPHPLTLKWGDSPQQKVVMERISDEYIHGPGYFALYLDDFARSNPLSKGIDVVIKTSYPAQKLKLMPNGAWQSDSKGIIRSNAGGMLEYIGKGYSGYIELKKSPTSPVVTISGSDGVLEKIDLYSEKEEWIKVHLPLNMNYTHARYRTSISRYALRNLKLTVEGIVSKDINKIFIGVLRPNVYGDTNVKYIFATWMIPPVAVASGATILLAKSVLLESHPAVLGTSLLIAIYTILIILRMIYINRSTAMGYILGPYREYHTSRFAWKYFVFFAVFTLIVGLFSLASFFPAVLPVDGRWQWDQLQSMKINDAHPFLHTLTLKLITLVWNSITAVALFHILVYSLLLAYAFTSLIRFRVPAAIAVIGFLVTACSIRNTLMIVNLFKDTTYSLIIFILIVILFEAIINTKFRNRLVYPIILGFILMLIASYRHNGVLTLIGMIPLLIIAFYRSRGFWITVVSTALLLFGFSQGVLKPVFVNDFSENMPASSILALRHISVLVNQDVPFSNAEYKLLSHVRSLHDRWDWRPNSTNPVFYNCTTNKDFLLKNPDVMVTLDKHFFLKYPSIYMAGILMETTSHYYPKFLYWNLPHETQIAPNQHGYSMKPILDLGHRLILKMINMTCTYNRNPYLTCMFWGAAYHLYFSIIAIIVLWYRTKDYRFLLLIVPALLNPLGYFLAPIAQDLRYVYPVALPTAFMVCLMFTRAIPSKVSITNNQNGGKSMDKQSS